MFFGAPDNVSKVPTMLLELCLEASQEGITEFNQMYNFAFSHLLEGTDKIEPVFLHRILSAAIDDYFLQEQKTVNINIQDRSQLFFQIFEQVETFAINSEL